MKHASPHFRGQALHVGGLAATSRDVGYLFRRAAFGGKSDAILAGAEAGVEATVAQLVDFDLVPDNIVPPPATAIDDSRSKETDDLTVWWLSQMVNTSRPLQEKLVLFWHGHFATGNSKVRSPHLMYMQNDTFRQNALGRFDDLLSAIYKDPAMLVWLDGARNTKQAPNENWGREVMELFVLGRGNYTEDDVHAMARAFTGWTLNRDTNEVRFIPRLHDDGLKTILGQTGNWGSEDAVRILAAHSATGTFLATCLWRFFASETPSNAAISRMADVYYSSNHSMREVVRTMFLAPEFYAKGTKTGHFKSPVEYVLAPMTQLGLPATDLSTLPRTLTTLGQTLFDPPNVGGWPGGAQWVNPATMLARFNYASRLTGDSAGLTAGFDETSLLTASGADRTDQLVWYVANSLGMQMTNSTISALMTYVGKGDIDRMDFPTKVRGLVHLALVSPEFQIA